MTLKKNANRQHTFTFAMMNSMTQATPSEKTHDTVAAKL